MAQTPKHSVNQSSALTPKRRRLLIATAVAVLLIGGGWWMTRPRVDQRFVGTWQDDDVFALKSFWAFKGDGAGKSWMESGNGLRVTDDVHWRWEIDGGELVIFESGPARYLPTKFVEWYTLATNRLLSGFATMRFEIGEVGPQSIIVTTNEEPITLHRVAD